jgi:diguanylate cyclase (GGDEF)-like protein
MSISSTESAIDSLLSSRLRADRTAPRTSAHASGRIRRLACRGAPDTGIVFLITFFAALAALVIAAVIPGSYFLAAQARVRGEIESGARQYAGDVAEAAQQNPRFWNVLAGGPGEEGFENLGFGRSGAADMPGRPDRHRVFTLAGTLLIDTAASSPLPAPLLYVRMPIGSRTSPLGEIEVARSLRPILYNMGFVACVSTGLGVLLFMALRVAPLRMLNAALEQATFLSSHDILTGLPNRRLFHARLQQALRVAARDGTTVALFYLDLDHFKQINDVFGHSTGDATLSKIAERLHHCLRAGDMLARLGGDEFAVIQTRLRRMEDAGALGQRLLAELASPIELDGNRHHVGLSAGVALSEPGQVDQADKMMKAADLALYRAKEEGRGRVCFFLPEMDLKLQERHAMEMELRAAILDQGLTLHYQPQVDLQTGQMLGAEALVRWKRAGHGMVSPEKFIPLAEDTGLIVPIGNWVLREACRCATGWPPHIGIAVNVSPVQFQHPGLYEAVRAALNDSGIAPGRLELEVTEGVLLQDTEQTLATLLRLQQLGVKLAMDDFGTGYSSLSYLQKFKFDRVKIDRSQYAARARMSRRSGLSLRSASIVRRVQPAPATKRAGRVILPAVPRATACGYRQPARRRPRYMYSLSAPAPSVSAIWFMSE